MHHTPTQQRRIKIMTDKDTIALALYIAPIRSEHPKLAYELEYHLYYALTAKYPETLTRYILELTEERVYQ